MEEFQVVCSSYSQNLRPNAASLLVDGPEEILEDHKECFFLRVQMTVTLKKWK